MSSFILPIPVGLQNSEMEKQDGGSKTPGGSIPDIVGPCLPDDAGNIKSTPGSLRIALYARRSSPCYHEECVTSCRAAGDVASWPRVKKLSMRPGQALLSEILEPL
jgi:hypothetical protein